MGVNVSCALAVHESAKCKDEEGNVGALATLVNVQTSDAIVIVDVVCYEVGCLKDVNHVFGLRWC